jgi:hypothetical protein
MSDSDSDADALPYVSLSERKKLVERARAAQRQPFATASKSSVLQGSASPSSAPSSCAQVVADGSTAPIGTSGTAPAPLMTSTCAAAPLTTPRSTASNKEQLRRDVRQRNIQLLQNLLVEVPIGGSEGAQAIPHPRSMQQGGGRGGMGRKRPR